MLEMVIYLRADGSVAEVRRSQIMPLWLARELGVKYLRARDETGQEITTLAGDTAVIADFGAQEEEGGALADYGANGEAVVAATWPEWLHISDVMGFDLEFEPDWSRHTSKDERPAHRLRALVHKTSGYRRDRAELEAEIARRIAARQAEADAAAAAIRAAMGTLRDAEGRFLPKPEVVVQPEPTYIGDLVGGSDEPLRLDADGQTVAITRTALEPFVPTPSTDVVRPEEEAVIAARESSTPIEAEVPTPTP